MEQEFQEQDQRYKQYAPMAAERVRFLFEAQDHFMHGHKASGKELRQKARDDKKALYLEIGVTGKEGGHQWAPKGRGLQCQHCKKQIHQRLPMAQLKEAKEEKREVAVGVPITGGNNPWKARLHRTHPGRDNSRRSFAAVASQLHSMPKMRSESAQKCGT